MTGSDFMREKIKILHVIPSLESGGGAQRQMVDVICRMDDTRFSNTVCYLYPKHDLASELLSAGVEVTGLGFRGRREGHRIISRLARLIKEDGFSIVHTWLYDADVFGRIAGRLAGARLIVSALQNSWYEPEVRISGGISRPKLELFRSLDGWTARWSKARFIACSELVKESMVKRLGLSSERIEMIYNAVDLDRFEEGESDLVTGLRAELGIRDNAPVLICVGRLVPQKGQQLLLEAMPQIIDSFPSAKLLLVGAGVDETMLKKASERKGLKGHVLFPGLRRDVRELLELSDIFVFPSLAGEGLPVAVIEAMAMRKPCVAWNLSPNPEVIEHEQSGLLVEAKQVEALAEAICRLAKDEQARRDFGARGRAIVERRFDIRDATRRYEALYERELGQPAARAAF